MTKYPPVDGYFLEWGMKMGMTEEEVLADWESYCDGLEQFHEEIIATMGEPVTTPAHFVVGGLD